MKRRLSIGLVAVMAVVAALLGTVAPPFGPPSVQGAPTVVATVPSGGVFPNSVAVNPGAGLVYVANSNSGDLSVLSGAPPFAAATLPIPVGVGAVPSGVAYNPNGDIVMVTDVGNDVMQAYLGTAPFSPFGWAGTGSVPTGVAANPNNNRVYVTDRNQPDVLVLDGTAPAFAFVAAIPQPPCGPGFPAGSHPLGVDVNPTTNQVYVTEPNANELWVMDGAAPWGCLPPIPVGNGPEGVAYNPANNQIYVANGGSNDVTIIDANTSAVVNPSLAVGAHPSGVAVNPTTNRVYVTNSQDNTVSVIDGSTNTVVDGVPVGAWPGGLAVDPTTNRIFVANSNDNTISVIEDAPAAPTPTPTTAPPPGPPPVGMEDVPLQGGTCNPVASTYADATPIATIDGAVAPAGILDSLWQYDGVRWYGYSPLFPAASDLTQMDRLDVVFICIGGSGPGAGMFSRPLV